MRTLIAALVLALAVPAFADAPKDKAAPTDTKGKDSKDAKATDSKDAKGAKDAKATDSKDAKGADSKDKAKDTKPAK